jgi:hypothetical protein
MSTLRVEAAGPKHLRLAGIPPAVADSLQQLATILAQRDTPAARRRLHPPPTADAPANAEWDSLITPDLRHLFVSAGETVTRDLTGLEPDPAMRAALRVTFPAEHLAAWMSALNQARLILGERHQVRAADMDRTDLDPRAARDLALRQIHLLGYVLEMLVGHAAQP